MFNPKPKPIHSRVVSSMLNPNTHCFTLESVRDSLMRQEDTILVCLIERAQFPITSTTTTLLDYFVKQSEALQAKIGRYANPEEHPFFPDDLPMPMPMPMPPQTYPQFLHPAAASLNINNMIWAFYFDKLLPLFVAQGDDGHYASAATWDLECLQALSRRIHYGKFVAEVKFRDSPQDYHPAIRAQDREALMKLLTFESVEKMVMQRVEKKAMIFGQQVSLNGTADSGKYKVDPSIASRLYAEWVMPLTKLVQVEYLLRRLD